MRRGPDCLDGRAESYALFRPGYPVAAFRDLFAACASDRLLVVDVGAGPGTSTRPLRAALPDNCLITAVEPCKDMRRVLAREFREDSRVLVVDGLAEALPLPHGVSGLIVACTAYHWFDRPAFFAEAGRIAAQGGIFALLCNRPASCALIEALDAYIAEASRDLGIAPPCNDRMEPTLNELSEVEGFTGASSATYTWSDRRDRRALIDLYLTRSSVWDLVRRVGLGRVMTELEGICDRHLGRDTAVTLTWETTVKWTQKG